MPEGVNDVFGGQVTFRLERGGGGVECKEGRGGVTALKVHLNFFFFFKQSFNFSFWNACVFTSSLIYSVWEGGLFAILSINCTFQGVSVECHHCSVSGRKGCSELGGFFIFGCFC